MDASGALSIAEHGTVLAEARTRSFDVLSHENYVAPGLVSFLRKSCPLLIVPSKHKLDLRNVSSDKVPESIVMLLTLHRPSQYSDQQHYFPGWDLGFIPDIDAGSSSFSV
jgi:hypothetical protein